MEKNILLSGKLLSPTGKALAVLVLSLLLIMPALRAQNTFPASGYVGIATTTPDFALTIVGTDWNSSQVRLFTYAGTPTPGGTDNYTPQFRFEKARGTVAFPVKVEIDDRIGAFLGSGWDGVKIQRSAIFGFDVDGTTNVNQVPMGFFVETGLSSAFRVERFRIKSNGNVVMSSLAGTGTRMVVANTTGTLSTQAIPVGGGAATLNDLTDVTLTTPAFSDILIYNGTQWVNSGINDFSNTNEIQNLGNSASGTNRTITISGGGTNTTFSVADNDNSATNEIQALSLAGNTLALSNGGGSVSLAAYVNTDAQTLAYNATTFNLSISGGNTVNINDNDWAWFSGSGLSGELYRSGDIALGTFSDPDGHGLNVQNYTNGKAAVRGADQSGASLYAEGMLGVLDVTSIGVPVAVTNAGVVGIKPALGGNGAAIYGWNLDLNTSNYAGLFAANGAASGGTNYGVYSMADNGLYNYAGMFEGRVAVRGLNGFNAASDSLYDLLTATVTHTRNNDTRAVSGISVPQPGYGFGVYGSGGWRGVYGYGNGQDYTGTTIGVLGSSSGSTGVGTRTGVHGEAYGGATNWAGYFASGNVFVNNDQGIGTLTPDARLHVSNSYGSDLATVLHVDQNSSTTTGTAYGIYVDNNPATTSTAYGIYTERISGADGARYGIRNYMSGGTGIRYGISSSVYADAANTSSVYGLYSYVSTGATTGGSYAGYFSGGSGTNEWSVYAPGKNYLGNVATINTTNPATGYALSVNGKIACSELLIDTYSSWPDYVFGEGYELMPIRELKASIETNGHLPGMPAAEEVEANGILSGDMHTRTLRKVEELTLYIIQLNDRLDALEAENTELKAKLSK
jgi:hypothetical protein